MKKFILLYLIPILLISFFTNFEKSLLVANSLFAALIWFLVEYYSRKYSNLFNPIWNAFVRFSVFIIIGVHRLFITVKPRISAQLLYQEPGH